jgi:TPR repeat protein
MAIHTCAAGESWQIVVLPDPSDPHTEDFDPLDNFHKVVSQGLVMALTNADFDVHDPQYLGLPNCIVEDCSHLTDQSIRQAAKTSGKEVNLALLYQNSAFKQRSRTNNEWQFVLSGRLLDLENGTQQDAFDVQGKFVAAPKNCIAQCLELWLNNHISILAQELGAVLSEKLAALPRRFSYQLQLNHFPVAELQQIDQQLKALPGYLADTLLTQERQQDQWLHQVTSRTYQYTTEQSAADLQSSLERLATEQGVNIELVYFNDRRQFVIQRGDQAYLDLYLALPLIALILLCLILFLVRAQRQKARQKIQTRVTQLHLEATTLGDNLSYVAAQEKISRALELPHNKQQTLALQLAIGQLQRGLGWLQLAYLSAPAEPIVALTLLAKARGLNPQLLQSISALEEQCRQRLNEPPPSVGAALPPTPLQLWVNTLRESSNFGALSKERKQILLKSGLSHTHNTLDELSAILLALTPDIDPTAGGADTQKMPSRLFSFTAIGLVLVVTAYGIRHVFTLPSVPTNLVSIEAISKQSTSGEVATQLSLRDNQMWQQAKALNSIEAYEQYLQIWPQGQHFISANGAIQTIQNDQHLWQQARIEDSTEAYQNYLKLASTGKFVSLARQQLAGLRAKNQQAQKLRQTLALANDYYFAQRDYPEAKHYYEQAAAMGHVDAQYQLGNMFLNALGGPQDLTQAARWYLQAANEEHAKSQAQIGFMYSKGQGLGQDYTQAVSWYRRAAQQGESHAQYNLAYCYMQGQGVAVDHQQAAFWYKKAAQQGDADAQNDLGKLYERGLGVEANIIKAKALYRQAAAQGNRVAELNLQMLANQKAR